MEKKQQDPLWNAGLADAQWVTPLQLVKMISECLNITEGETAAVLGQYRLAVVPPDAVMQHDSGRLINGIDTDFDEKTMRLYLGETPYEKLPSHLLDILEKTTPVWSIPTLWLWLEEKQLPKPGFFDWWLQTAYPNLVQLGLVTPHPSLLPETDEDTHTADTAVPKHVPREQGKQKTLERNKRLQTACDEYVRDHPHSKKSAIALHLSRKDEF
ncbi:MAG: hypothetical protein HQL48_08010, partial [Gammaproteobacteria bacterium]|nr:hypothetical protein [Gammaproteobacteria bacterium]